MTTASKAIAKFYPNQFTDAVIESAQRIVETVQTKLEKTQQEGRIVLSRQVLKGADRASDLSKALTDLSKKIAPVAKAKPKAASRAKTKPVAKKAAVKAVAKPRVRKAAAAAA